MRSREELSCQGVVLCGNELIIKLCLIRSKAPPWLVMKWSWHTQMFGEAAAGVAATQLLDVCIFAVELQQTQRSPSSRPAAHLPRAVANNALP